MITDPVDRALRYLIWAGLTLLLFMPLIVSTQTIFPFIVGKAIYARIVIALVFGLWAVLAYRNASFRPPPSRLLLILGIYLFVSFLAGIFGVSFQRSLWSTFERMQGIVDLAHWLALLVVVVSVIRTRTHWLYFLNANIGISLLVAFIGLSQSFGWTGLPFYSYLEADARIGITLGNPAFVATYMMLNAIVAAGLLMQSFWPSEVSQPNSQARRRRAARRDRQVRGDLASKFWRVFWIVVVVVNLWVMTLTGTRGAVIGLIAGIGFFTAGYVIVGGQVVLKRYAIALFAGVIVLGLLVIALKDSPMVRIVASNNVLIQRMIDIRADQNPFTTRAFALTVGYKSILERPILGWGPENYLVPFGRYFVEGATSLEVLDQAHNKPIEELVTKGVLGLAAYLAIWFFTFRIIIRRVKDADQRDQIFFLAIASALAAYFVQNLFLFDTPVSSLQYIVLAAFVVSLEVRDGVDTPDVGQPKLAMGSQNERDVGVTALRKVINTARGSRQIVITLSVGGLVAALALVTLSLWLNIRAYSAAGAILDVSRRVSSLDVALATVNRSINTFPPLANYPRLIYIKNVSILWSGLADADRQRVLELADRAADEAIAAEPENWRIHVIMGEMYISIVGQETTYGGLDLARHYLDIAKELAPERSEVAALQHLVEIYENQRDATPKQ